MKRLLALLLLALVTTAGAADTTAPTLEIQHTWVEKVSGKTTFKMLLDPKDDTGFTPNAAIQFRSKLNSVAPLPDNTPWETYPWVRGRAFEIAYNCTSVIFEVRAIDAAGNVSPLQRRTYASPFPLSTAPNLEPKLVSALPFTGSAIDCRGLFSMDFDGQGVGDDIMEIDRTTGQVRVRRQGAAGDFSIANVLQLTANSINDSAVADFNGDGRPDLAVVVDNTLKVFTNDGVVGGNLQFTESPPAGLSTTGISTVLYCAVGDITGEGKPEIIISGTGDDGMAGSRTRVAWLLNNYQFQLGASNYALPDEDTGAGRLGVGDVSGDGWADVVMADTENNELVLFYNRGNGSLAGDDEVNVDLRPDRAPTGYALGGLPAESLVVGDVTGDGRADAVITAHYFGATGAEDGPNATRDHQFWQLFEGRPPQSLNGLNANNLYLVGEKGPIVASSTPFKSHVILQDLTDDRFPEIVLTSRFQTGSTAGGVEVVRVVAKLNEVNIMTGLNWSRTSYATGVNNPHRLTAGRFNTNEKRDILVANADVPPLVWVFNVYTPTTKATDIQGGASTSSDIGGTAGPNGTYSYYEYAGGGTISYSVTYTNNTKDELTNVVIEAALPAEFQPVVTAMGGGTITGTGSSRVVRWTENVAPYSTGVKNYQVRLVATAKAGASLAPKISLKQGTKILVSSTLPVVKVAAPNLTVVPNSPGQPWSFTFKPFVIPSGILVTGLLQTSVNGTTWTSIPMGIMSLSNGVYTRTETNVPTTARYFRAALFSEAGYKYSSVFSNILPPTTDLRVQTKSPPKTGQTWTFSATQPSTAADVHVRFQCSTTPYVEGSWTDLPFYTFPTRAGSKWTFNTYNIPAGNQYFRAISAAPGWVDSIGAQLVGPVPVQQSSPQLPYFTYYHIDFKGTPRNGDTAKFMASCAAVPGLQVRFQSKLDSENDSAWTDLPNCQAVLIGTKWTFTTKNMPVGYRNWRVIASAPGYNDNTQRIDGQVVSEAKYTFEVFPAPLPQIATEFGPFNQPANESLLRSGAAYPVSVDLFDFNGVQKVFLETSAKPEGPFKEVKGINFSTPPAGSVTYSSTVTFTGTGDLYLRIACLDGYTVSQTQRSEIIKVTIGPGNGGTTGPNIYNLLASLTQATRNSPGSVTINCNIGDDVQVRRAYVHQVKPPGSPGDPYLRTVGEMTRKGTSGFTCVDEALPDGSYHYRVVAHDYDGNETISGTTTAVTVTTPAPPPSPINLDIPYAYQTVQPKLTAQVNYKYMPFAKSGIVKVNYSGLPAGKTTIVVYRKDLSSDKSYYTTVVSKTSGQLEIPAPTWDRKNHSFQGPGEYRVIALFGGLQLDVANGDDTFNVGRSWNQPDTFSTLDYGLYWFKDANSGLKGISSSQRDEYFDPDRPTVIYVHGWQVDEVKVRRRESWLRQDPFNDAKLHDMCKIWRDQGYNVGIFNWNQFGCGDLFEAEYNIYTIQNRAEWGPGHSMIYTLSSSEGTMQRYYEPDGEGGPIEDKTVTDLFLEELARCMGGYVPDEDTKEFRVIGHSLGTQLTARTFDAVRQHPEWGIPLPTRISLLELAQIHGFNVFGLHITELQTQYINGLRGAGIPIDCYQSTDLQSLLAINLNWVGAIHDMCAYSRWRPDFISPISLKVAPWDVPTKSHNEIVRWYMESFNYEPHIWEAWTYHFHGPRKHHVGDALSASTSNFNVRYLMNHNYYYEQAEGKGTQSIHDDVWERKGSEF